MTGETNGNKSISVILPVYQGDSPEYLSSALHSLQNQTRTAEEILIIEDGPITDSLDRQIREVEETYSGSIRRHSLSSNQGLPTALQRGVKEASNDLLARMDADDISVPERFELQYDFLTHNPNVDVVGGQLVEINPKSREILATREVPATHEQIKAMAKTRSPINHGTVMMRRDEVLDAGNYRSVRRMEDYDLWVRMLLNGAKFANIDKVLLRARAGDDLYGRRGGIEYAVEEFNRQREFLQRGFITPPRFLANVTSRVGLRLLPNQLRAYIYEQLARDS